MNVVVGDVKIATVVCDILGGAIVKWHEKVRFFHQTLATQAT